MRLKKITAFICASVMVLSLIGCGGNGVPGEGGDSASDALEASEAGQEDAKESDIQKEEGGSDASELEEIVFAVPLSKTVDMAPIEAELNEILVPKIGVRVKLEGITIANYGNQVGLMMAGNEQLDVVGMLSAYSSMLAKNQLLNLDDYLDEYGAGIREVLGDEFLKSTSKAGSIYAVPNNNGKAAVINILMRQDLIDELNLPVDQLKQAADYEEYYENLDLLTEMFAQIKEAHPEMVCLVPTSANPNNMLFNTELPFVDRLNDNYGVLMPGEDSVIENVFKTEEFAKLCEYAYNWNQAGYILEDATTTQEAANTYVQNNRTSGYFIKGEEGQAEQITTATGIEMESIKIVEPYLSTSDINGISFGISATSTKPEAAMKFMNEMYTNTDVANLLAWGIEGQHYEVQEDGTVDFPEGVDANNTTYGLNMDWFFGNQFLTYIWGQGRDTTIYSRLDENNKTAATTPVLGFSYDSTVVSTEIAAITNVINQYLPGLSCGSLNPETEIPKFLDALEDAGLDKVIQEKQNQLDAWKLEN